MTNTMPTPVDTPSATPADISPLLPDDASSDVFAAVFTNIVHAQQHV